MGHTRRGAGSPSSPFVELPVRRADSTAGDAGTPVVDPGGCRYPDTTPAAELPKAPPWEEAATKPVIRASVVPKPVRRFFCFLFFSRLQACLVM
eukprot:4315796-Amphidinium_carterae.1